MKQSEYIDKAKEKLGLTSDYAFHLETNISRSDITRYRRETRKFDEYASTVIGEILNIDPLDVIADIQSQLEKNEEKREFWIHQIGKRQAGMMPDAMHPSYLLIFVAGILFSPQIYQKVSEWFDFCILC